MCETEAESARCEQVFTCCPTASWDQLVFVMTSFHPDTSLHVLMVRFFSLAIWFIFY